MKTRTDMQENTSRLISEIPSLYLSRNFDIHLVGQAWKKISPIENKAVVMVWPFLFLIRIKVTLSLDLV